MSEHPLELSARLIDSGDASAEPNRITQELSELAEGIALVESFSHVVVVDCGDGLVAFDASAEWTAPAVIEALRGWSPTPIDTLVYTHGHLDHVGGSGAFAADAAERGHRPIRVVGHERVAARFERYEWTAGYNRVINARQFGGAAVAAALAQTDEPFLPAATLRPDVTYREQLDMTVGDTRFELRHCLGETDDHTWTYVPEHRLISAGDQFIWMFPNCGNPQKVQRYPLEWAASLREMAATDVELFVPAHGLPIGGHDRIVRCLDTVADTLEALVHQVVDAMNAGAVLDDILHSIHVPDDTLSIPFLRPLYDEPEFVIRNIWRLYGGWWDGNPARLKPPPDAALGAEVCGLAGGAEAVTARARELSDAGDHRTACQLVEWAAAADPDSPDVHAARIDIYRARRRDESSLMAKGIFGSAVAESKTVLDGEAPDLRPRLRL
jgi:alkyl sulfatase BDS1-like metallo-beta-lactamase superfamily hydrolase